MFKAGQSASSATREAFIPSDNHDDEDEDGDGTHTRLVRPLPESTNSSRF